MSQLKRPTPCSPVRKIQQDGDTVSEPPPAKRPRQRSSSVSFAAPPEEVKQKHNTPDGHPDHTGNALKPRRRTRTTAYPPLMQTTEDLTADNIELIESELGEECAPSVARLRRRAGLLPPRPRPSEYLAHLMPQGRKPGYTGFSIPLLNNNSVNSNGSNNSLSGSSGSGSGGSGSRRGTAILGGSRRLGSLNDPVGGIGRRRIGPLLQKSNSNTATRSKSVEKSKE